MELNQEEDMVG